MKIPPADPPRSADIAVRRSVWGAATVIVVAAGLAYGNSFGVPFLFDDLPAIVENTSLPHLWPLGAVLFPDQAGGVTSSGRPLVNLSLALNHAISGTRVGSYHAFNLAVHLGVALGLLGLVRRTLLTPTLRARFGGASLTLAATVALLWALHPLPSAAVTYVIQRAEALAALCLVFTLYTFLRAVDSPVGARWRMASVGACFLGMGCKETMAVAPLVVFLFDRTFVSGTVREAWRRHGRWHAAYAATWLVLGALVLATGGNRGGTAGFATDVSVWSYALTQCRGVVGYLGLALWPSPLVFDYGLGTVRRATEVLPHLALLLGGLGLTVVALRRWPAAGFLGAWFFLLLAPSSSVIPIATQTLAEHRMYLPLAAPVVAAALAAYAGLGRRALVPAAIAALALGAATAARNRDYRSELAIWGDTAAKRPDNARAHNNHGQALFRVGRIPEAVAAYERALALQPKYPETHYNLGVARLGQGDVAGAIAHYERALHFQPDYPEALNNLGNALIRAGRPDEARRRYEEAVARRPAFAAAHNNLGNALLQAGRPAEARQCFERALRLRPDEAETHYNLGNALAAAGEMAAALTQFQRALQLDPRNAPAHVNTGNTLLELKRPTEALRHYEAALAVDPALPDAHFNRGSVLLDLERWADAVPAFEAVLRLDPAAGQVHRPLGYALAQSGRITEAIAQFERHLQAHPDDAATRQELSRLRAAGLRQRE